MLSLPDVEVILQRRGHGQYEYAGAPVTPLEQALQATHFIAQAAAQDAVQLRIWDDQAKVAGATTPRLAHFLARAARCALA